MPAVTPPKAVVDAYLAGARRTTRRIEIYEADGRTPWTGIPLGDPRLIGGSVTVDFDRDERRSLDLVLDNHDGKLDYDSGPGRFWYDKVIKVFKGIELNIAARAPRLVIVEDQGLRAVAFKNAMLGLGYTDVSILTTVATVDDLAGYDIVVGMSTQDVPTQNTLLTSAYDNGWAVLTIGTQGTSGVTYPRVISTYTAKTAGAAYVIDVPRDVDSYLGDRWASQVVSSTEAGKYIATLAPGTKTYAVRSGSGPAIVGREDRSNRWLHIQAGTIGDSVDSVRMLQAAVNWLNPNKAMSKWEVQLGEFMIDSLEDENFPHSVVIQGRDYTKKCLLFKFPYTRRFVKTMFTSVQLISLIAQLSGISSSKIIQMATGVIVTADYVFDAGKSGWEAMTDIATDWNHEIFFDNTGNLVIRNFNDPTTSPVMFRFETGEKGSLVTYKKSTNDSNIFNEVIVIGESSNSGTPPVSAFARNEVGPASWKVIGLRTTTYKAANVTTVAQALAIAKRMILISSLEEYGMDWSAICIDWLDAGDIVEVFPERASAGAPSRFLMSSVTVPLELGPMSANGKRMLIVKPAGPRVRIAKAQVRGNAV